MRIGIESDRVSEERRVYVKCDQCPVRFHLGEQAEVLIRSPRSKRRRWCPRPPSPALTAARGRCGRVENGRLARRAVSFGHRTRGFAAGDQWTAFPMARDVVSQDQLRIAGRPIRAGRARRPSDELGLPRRAPQPVPVPADLLRAQSAPRRRAGDDRHLSRHRRRRPDGGTQSPCRPLGGRGRIARAVRRGLAHSRRQPRRRSPALPG